MREDDMARRRRAIAFATLPVLSLLFMLAAAASAYAVTVTNQRPLLFSFDGSDTTAGKFQSISTEGLEGVAFDDATGNVYVIDGGGEAVDKFDAEGNAENYAAGPAAGTSSLFGPSVSESFKAQQQFFFSQPIIAVDNSGGLGGAGEGEQGRLYIGGGSRGPIDAFDRNGTFLWSLPVEDSGQEVTKGSCGITVDTQGHLWIAAGGATREFPEGFENYSREKLLEFETTGSGPPPTTPIQEIDITNGAKEPCRVAVDKSGEDFYVSQRNTIGGGSAETSLDKYVGETYDSTLSTKSIGGIAVDQTENAGSIFAVTDQVDSTLDEYEPCSAPGCGGALVSSSDPGLIGQGRGVAYNPSKDWVYVPDHLTETVKVFGPRAGGPVPTVSEGESDELTKTEATAHGTVNPAGLSNSYHFELVKAEVQKLVVSAPGGRFWLGTTHIYTRSTPPFPTRPPGDTEPLPFDITPAELQAELEGIFGADNVQVTGTAATSEVPGEFRILFVNELAGRAVGTLQGQFLYAGEEEIHGGIYKGGHTGAFAGAEVTRISPGQLWGESAQQRTRPEAFPSIEPDSSNHAVSLRFGGLRPNTSYDVRLVGTNTEPEGDPEKRLDNYSSADTFTTLPPPPPDVSTPSIAAVTTISAQLSATVDPHEDETTWRIFVSTEVSYGGSKEDCEALPLSAYKLGSEGNIPLGEAGPVAIEKELTGLESGETYCVRVVAINGGGTGKAEEAFTTPTVQPTEAALAFVAPRTDTSARLNAYVNPAGGAPLTYRFEYSTDGTNWTPLTERVSTTNSHHQIVVADEVTGLSPNTTYFYRLGLVKNEAGEVAPSSLTATTKTFTTRTSSEMTIPPNAFGEAEKRGFEMVNNPDKGTQNARAAELEIQMSPLRADGEEFLWTVLGGAPGSNSGTQATFLAKRGASGWTSQSLVPSASEQVGGGGLTYFPVAASPDFSSFIFAPAEPAVLLNGPPTYVRLNQDGQQQVLHSYQSFVGRRVATTTDLDHVLIVDPDTNKLEDIGSGNPEEIGLIPAAGSPEGVPQAGGSNPACGINGEGGSFTGGGGSGGAADQFEPGYQRMDASDASRVYFQVHPDSDYPACNGKWALYERNREAEPATTTPIVSAEHATSDTEMIRATPDGRSLYFVSSAKLASVDGNGHIDIYRWDEGAGKSTCLTCNVKSELGQTVSDANLFISNGHPERVKISDDFSHLYFNSANRLVSKRGIQGTTNLYVLSGGKIHFVAPSAPLVGRTPLSADGNVLTFLSDKALTADSIAKTCPDFSKGGKILPCQELYRYDDRDGSLECLSCRHGGTTTNNVALTGFGEPFQVSADSSTAAFVTAEALVPRDVNNSADLYEWRNGKVRLVTDGVTRYPTGYAGPIPQAIDDNGSNIVFSVASPGLTGFERDGLANMYDARLGGGFTPPSPVRHCSDESCQGPLQPAPQTTAPANSTYHGPGNELHRPKCPKGKVRRHGRCVKKHHRKHHHHRRARR